MRIRGMRIKNGREKKKRMGGRNIFLLHIKRHIIFFHQPGYCNANQFSFSKIKQNWHNTKPNQGRGIQELRVVCQKGGHPSKRKVLVTQSRTLWTRVDCSPPGSSVHGILQARILEWVSIPFSRDLPDPGIEPGSPPLQADSLPSELKGIT